MEHLKNSRILEFFSDFINSRGLELIKSAKIGLTIYDCIYESNYDWLFGLYSFLQNEISLMKLAIGVFPGFFD